ncbi:MAG: tryptophan--tRNA ligase [Candidatus Aenigmarchaeota archaeon]|nr:tryptophan--tRNA ligase [Candidatus Aenigmarchaeota archaeon]
MTKEINPWGSDDVKDYRKIMKEFGISPFSGVMKKLKEPHLLMRRGIVFGHRGFDSVMASKNYALMTGLMPSGKFHLGHKILADQIIYHQRELGAHVFLCVADVEAYNMRLADMKKLRETAIEEYLLNYIALGLEPKKCDFYFQSERSRDSGKSNAYYRLAGMAANKVTMNELKAIYGELSPGKIMSVMLQVSDILHPQLPEFGGLKNVVVPVGIDQDPHIRLSRDIAARFSREFGFRAPAATYHKFILGLKGGKMSSSDPYSYIALTDSPEEAKKKIYKYAFSGGRKTVEEHRKHGGNPDIDVSFQYLYSQFEPDDRKITKIRDDYSSGKLLTGELKQILIEKLTKFLEEHQKKREAARKKVDRFLDK